jgi:hypothetical protein
MDNPDKLATQGTQDEENKTKTQHNMCLPPLCANNVNKTWAHLQTTVGKDEPNIVFMRKS